MVGWTELLKSTSESYCLVDQDLLLIQRILLLIPKVMIELKLKYSPIHTPTVSVRSKEALEQIYLLNFRCLLPLTTIFRAKVSKVV